MGFRRYVAPSAREALDRIRKELGPEAVILSNRRSSSTGRVEIIAAAPGEMRALVDGMTPAAAHAPEREPAQTVRGATARIRPAPTARVAPESFQEFIRRQAPTAARVDALALYDAVAREPEAEAVLEPAQIRDETSSSRVQPAPPAVFRRRPSRLDGADARSAPLRRPTPAEPELPENAARTAPPTPTGSEALQTEAVQPKSAPTAAIAAVPVQVQATARSQSESSSGTAETAVSAPRTAPAVAPAIDLSGAASRAHAGTVADAGVMAELQSLRSALTDRITHLEAQIAPISAPAKGAVDPAPLALKRQAMTRLLMSGFSPELARRLAESVPANLDRKEADPWLQNNLAQQIHCPGDADNALLAPGAVALVGPTGVGKTTTIAKLAARFVVRHGAGALGLITLDSYRMGAHEQLRSYGRILGVAVQIAHDAASLCDLLRSMHGKRKVLIDTCGMSQRDSRLGEMLAMLADARFTDQEIRRVLLINAASHAETLDEVARAWRMPGTKGAILTKIDEAARIGGGLDALIRYQLPLLGLTNGQRVPEDWHPGNAGLLAHIALKPFGASFCLDNSEIQALSSPGVALV